MSLPLRRIVVVVDLTGAPVLDVDAAAAELERVVRDQAVLPGRPAVGVADVTVYDRGLVAPGLPEYDDAEDPDHGGDPVDPAGSALAVLHRARALIADSVRWCTRAPARDLEGAEVAPDDPAAVAWCASGALDRAAHDLNVSWEVSHRACRALEDATVRLHGHYLPQEVNDLAADADGGHTAVVELYDAAIADLADTTAPDGGPLGVDECAALAAADDTGRASADVAADFAAVLDRARATCPTLGEDS